MRSQRQSGGKIEVVDDEYPEIIGIGKTMADAEKDFERQKRIVWTAKRISNIQATIDNLLFQAEAATEAKDDFAPINREQHRELQEMMDEFVGLQRVKGVVETAIEHKETGAEHRPIRRRGT